MSLGLPPTSDPAIRICPQCGAETTLAVCRKDGFATVERARYVKRPAHDRAGETIAGRWRLESVLRAEPLGIVYRAIDTHARADERAAVAVRVLAPEIGASLERIARFQREGRFLAGLANPGIVRVFEHGVAHDGTLYVAEELALGERLVDVVARGPMDVVDVVALGRALFEALREAHAHGLQHRSLSLQDVWWGRDGRIQVGGFGWVKILADEQPAFTFPRELGHAFATMAPEQARGKGVSGHADLYSAGAILYAALTGVLPFGDGTPSDLLVAHAVKMPKVPERDGQTLHGPIVDLVLRCLEKKPWNRPDGAQAALDALDRLAERPFQHTGPAAYADTPAPTPDALQDLAKAAAAKGPRTVERRAERPALPVAALPADAPRIVRTLRAEPVALPEPVRTRELAAAAPGRTRAMWPWVVAVALAIGAGVAVGLWASRRDADPLPTPSARLTENTLAAGLTATPPVAEEPPRGPEPGPAPPAPDAAPPDLTGLTRLALPIATTAVVVAPPPAWPAPIVARTPREPLADPSASRMAAPATPSKATRDEPTRPSPLMALGDKGKPPTAPIDPFADLEDPSIAPQAKPPAVPRKVLVDSDPPGASVSIEGRPAGQTPIYVEWDDVGGTVDIRLDKPGFRTIATSLGPRTGRAVFLVLKALDTP